MLGGADGGDTQAAEATRAAARRASAVETEQLVAAAAVAAAAQASFSRSFTSATSPLARPSFEDETGGNEDGEDDDMFKSEVERSVDDVVSTWRAGGARAASNGGGHGRGHEGGAGGPGAHGQGGARQDQAPISRFSSAFSQLFSRRDKKPGQRRELKTGTTRRLNTTKGGRVQQTRRESALTVRLLRQGVFAKPPAERTHEDIEEAHRRLQCLHNDFLRRCGDDVVRSLSRTVELKCFHAGDVVFRQNDWPAEKFYIIVTGRVRVSVQQIGGDRPLNKMASLRGSSQGDVARAGAVSAATEEALALRAARAGVARYIGGRRPSRAAASLAEVSRQATTSKGGNGRGGGGAGGEMSKAGVAGAPRALGAKSHTVAELGDTDSFGELSLLNDAPRSATVTCMTESSMLVVKRHDFDRFMKAAEQKLLSQKVKTLRGLKQFAVCDDTHCREIAQFFAEHEYAEGDIVDLDSSELVHFIIKGDARLCVRAIAGDESRPVGAAVAAKRGRKDKHVRLMEVQTVGVGSNFGETGICLEHRRGWVLQVTSPVLRTYEINRVQLLDHVDPRVLYAIQEEIAFRTSYLDDFYDGAVDRVAKVRACAARARAAARARYFTDPSARARVAQREPTGARGSSQGPRGSVRRTPSVLNRGTERHQPAQGRRGGGGWPCAILVAAPTGRRAAGCGGTRQASVDRRSGPGHCGRHPRTQWQHFGDAWIRRARGRRGRPAALPARHAESQTRLDADDASECRGQA